MKLNPINPSIQQQIFNAEREYWGMQLTKPNPPTVEAVAKAQFIDKTYHWKNADLRSGNGRLPKSSN